MDEIVWYLRALNAIRGFFGRQEKRYLTDHEWREYMRSIIPTQRPRGWLAKSMGPVPPEVAAALRVLERYNVKWPNDASVKHVD